MFFFSGLFNTRSNCRIPCHIESFTEKYWLHGTRYAVSKIYKSESCPSCGLRGMRYAVSKIYKSESCLSSWLRGTRYPVCNIYKTGSCLSSGLRGTRYTVCNICKTRICLHVVAGYAVRGAQCVIYSRWRSVLEVGTCFGSWIKERVTFMSCTLVSALGLMSF